MNQTYTTIAAIPKRDKDSWFKKKTKKAGKQLSLAFLPILLQLSF
jgi:hypothetical protein